MEFINKNVALIISLLLLFAVIYMLLVQQDELEQTQVNRNISSFISFSNVFSNYNSSISNIQSSNSNNKLTVADNNLPSFKSTRHSDEKMEMATDVDFKCNDYKSEKSNTKSINKSIKTDAINNVDSTSIHSINQNMIARTSHFEQNTDGQYCTQNKKTVSNSVIEIAAVSLSANAQIVSNNSTESFITNNSLTITNDLAENNPNGPIHVDGLPGDPGIIPVGDALLPLMLFLMIYGCWKVVKIIPKVGV